MSWYYIIATNARLQPPFCALAVFSLCYYCCFHFHRTARPAMNVAVAADHRVVFCVRRIGTETEWDHNHDSPAMIPPPTSQHDVPTMRNTFGFKFEHYSTVWVNPLSYLKTHPSYFPTCCRYDEHPSLIFLRRRRGRTVKRPFPSTTWSWNVYRQVEWCSMRWIVDDRVLVTIGQVNDGVDDTIYVVLL